MLRSRGVIQGSLKQFENVIMLYMTYGTTTTVSSSSKYIYILFQVYFNFYRMSQKMHLCYWGPWPLNPQNWPKLKGQGYSKFILALAFWLVQLCNYHKIRPRKLSLKYIKICDFIPHTNIPDPWILSPIKNVTNPSKCHIL